MDDDTQKGTGTDIFDEAEKQQGDVFDQAASASTRETPKPGFGNRYSEVTLGTQHPVGQAQSEWENLKAHPVDTLVQSAKTAAMMPVNLAYNAVHHPIDTLTGITGGKQFSEDLSNKNYAGMAGDVAGGLTNAALLAKSPSGEGAAEGIAENAPKVRDAIGTAARKPPLSAEDPGALKPSVAGMGRFGSSLAGAAIGGGPGAVAGGLVGRGLTDALLPRRPYIPPPTELDQFGFPASENQPGWSVKLPGRMPKNFGAVGSPTQESGYYPSITKVPIRPEPPYKLTPESVPGPDTAGKGNLLSPLAKAGDPRAAQELMRRGRNVLYVPAEEYPPPRSSEVLKPPGFEKESVAAKVGGPIMPDEVLGPVVPRNELDHITKQIFNRDSYDSLSKEEQGIIEDIAYSIKPRSISDRP